MADLSGLRVVFATTVLPDERATGGEICSQEIVDALVAANVDLRVVGYERIGRSKKNYPSRIYSAGDWYIEMEEAGWRKYLWLAQAYAKGLPFTQSKFYSRAYESALRSAVGSGADILIIDHAHMGWVDKLIGLPRKRIFVAHNLEHLLYKDIASSCQGLRASIYKRESKLLLGVERGLCQDCSTVLCLSTGDRDGLIKAGAEATKIKVLDLPGQAFEPETIETPKRYDIGMIGSWNWEANRKGMHWFLQSVLPNLPSDCEIGIAGGGSDSLPVSDPRVTLLGRVPDAATFMRSCRVLAVPTVVGSGIQLKTIEGISIGVPMVVTPMALRGITDVPAHVHSSEDALMFAKKLIDAQADQPSKHIGKEWAKKRRNIFQEYLRKYLYDVKISNL